MTETPQIDKTRSTNVSPGDVPAVAEDIAITGRPDTSADRKPVKIMVVDDSETIRRSASSLLKDEGFDVVTADDGFDAIAKIVSSRPDIVFADVSMPRLDGYQTCALIKNNPGFRHIPVVMLSSKDSIFDKARGRLVGSEHYLTKPFTRRDLIRAVKRHARSG